MVKKLVSWGLLSAVIALAVVFRFYDIWSYPAGLHGGESSWFTAPELFGIGFWQVHALSAAIGVATVLATYLATRVWFGRLAGLLAAFFLATNHWQVTVSRAGWRVILVPLCIALFTAGVGYTVRATAQGRHRLSIWYAGLTGLVLAAGFYVQVTVWGMSLVVLGIVTLLALASLHKKIAWPHFERYGKQFGVGLLAFVVGLLPLVRQLKHDASMWQELGYSGLASLSLVSSSLRNLFIDFFTTAQYSWLHTVPGFPLLNSLVALLFLLGLAWSLRGFLLVVGKIIRGVEVHLGMIYGYMLLLSLGMLALAVLMVGEQGGLSAIGLVVPVFMLAGCAGSVVIYWFRKRLGRLAVSAVWYGLVIGVLMLSVLYDGALYFLVARNDAEAHAQYRSDLVVVTDFINGKSSDDIINIVLEEEAQHVLELLGANITRYRFVNLDSSTIEISPGERILFTASKLSEADVFEGEQTSVELVATELNRFGREVLRVYQGVAVPSVEGVQDEEPVGDFGLDA